MHLFSYVVTHDSGFAPNPFGGILTLATCKPRIRQHARIGDYIVGTGSAATVGNDNLVYASEIAQIISLAEYGESPEYEHKRPSTRGPWWHKHGDNIYFVVDGLWKQRRNIHHGQDAMDRDLSGESVLICTRFWYFGEDAITIPPQLRSIVKKGPGHKRITDDRLVDEFIEWINTLPEGRHGKPEMQEEQTTSRCSQS